MIGGHEIRMVRTKLGETQAIFGKRFNVKDSAVSQWEKGTSIPTASTMSKLERLHAEYFRSDRIAEDGATYKAGNLAEMSARQIADVVYRRLPREARAQIDGEYAAAVMRELAKHESKGDKDDET